MCCVYPENIHTQHKLLQSKGGRGSLESLNLNWNFERVLRVFLEGVGRGGGLKSNDPYGRGISGTTHFFTAIHQIIMNLYFILNTHFRLSNLEELVVNHNELEVFVLFISRYIEIIKNII